MPLTVVCAVTLDGKLSDARRGPVRFTSSKDRSRLHALRDEADAIIVGATTIRSEDPPLLPDAERSERRRARGKKPSPVRAIFSKTLDLPFGRALARKEGAPLYIFTGGTADEGKKERLEAVGALVRTASPREALQLLEREQEATRVLCEGGGALNAAFFRDDLVDELELTLCPVILGGTSAPSLVDGELAGIVKRARLMAHEVTSEGEVFLRYSFR